MPSFTKPTLYDTYYPNTLNLADRNLSNVHKPLQFKNRIINGDFQIWQRGTSFTFNTNGQQAYTCDRISSKIATDGEFVISRSTIDFMNSVKCTVNTAPSDLSSSNYWEPFRYLFEGQHLYDIIFNRKYITISFIFRSNVGGKFSVALRNLSYFGNTGTWDETKVDSYVTVFDYTTPDIPKKVEIVVKLDNSWSYDSANNEKLGFSLDIGFLNQDYFATTTTNQWLSGQNVLTTADCVNWAASVGNYIEIAQLQLEEGQVATDFEYVPYDVQLVRCQRYYEYGENIDNGTVAADSRVRASVYFKNNKRVVPSISLVKTEGSGQDATIEKITPYLFSYEYGATNAGYYSIFTFYADAEL